MGGSIVDTRFYRSDRDTIYKLVLSYSMKAKIEEDMKRRTRRGKKKSDEGKKNIVCARRDRMSELIKQMVEHREPLLLQMLEYNWAELVYNVLHTAMDKAKKTITKMSEGNRSRGGYMRGFASVLVIRRDKFGEEEEDVDSDGADKDGMDDKDDSDGGDEDEGNEEGDDEGNGEDEEGNNEGNEEDEEGGDEGNEEDEEGNGGDMDEDVGGDAEVGEDVDRLNVDKDDGGDGGND
ncbi:RNA polymerase-associated protein LEO1-like [Asparagus officinalis]|uniref:RNA polymerase-associated protein LEO1-like n=1 Tax=Asparagus officinalis TaxID=4686 RepID=UPI00098DEC0C|nr:RNA polymerase-associated protein LEO1-like [Asparagus officinalis]